VSALDTFTGQQRRTRRLEVPESVERGQVDLDDWTAQEMGRWRSELAAQGLEPHPRTLTAYTEWDPASLTHTVRLQVDVCRVASPYDHDQAPLVWEGDQA